VLPSWCLKISLPLYLFVDFKQTVNLLASLFSLQLPISPLLTSIPFQLTRGHVVYRSSSSFTSTFSRATRILLLHFTLQNLEWGRCYSLLPLAWPCLLNPVGVPGWLSRLSVWLLTSAQVVVSGSWDQAPCRALCSAWSRLLPLPPPACPCALSLLNN